MEELLGVVRLGSDVDTLSELERSLEHRRSVATGADDCEALVYRDVERLVLELALEPRSRASPRLLP